MNTAVKQFEPVASPGIAWLIRQKAGTAKLYLTMRGGWTMDLKLARQFPDAESVRTFLGKRQGKPIPFWLDAQNNPEKEMTS